MGKLGLSARDLGEFWGVTAEVMNRLLRDEGILDGSPGAYGLTPKGLEFGVHQHHHRGNGGSAMYNRYWVQTYYDNSIIKALNITPEKIASVRDAMAADKLAAKVAAVAAQAEAEASTIAEQLSAAAAAAAKSANRRKIGWAVGATIFTVTVTVSGIIAVRKYGPQMKATWDEKAAPRLARMKDRITGVDRTALNSEAEPDKDDDAN